METKIIKIETDQLEKVVENSGLAIQEGEDIKKSYLPFLLQLSEAQAQAQKINFDNPSKLDEDIARELRLTTVKIRTGAEKLKEERKKMYLLRGNLEQASYNLIAASCKLTEEVFYNVEKAREIAEKKRQEALKKEREEKLSPYTEDVIIYPLGLMKDEEFQALYISLRTAHEQKIEAEKKAEEERIAKEKAEAEERERIRKENELLKKQAEERERLAAIERKKQAEILAEQKRKSEIEKATLEARARKEREERERLEKQIKAKKEAEDLAQKQAQEKAIKEEKERAEALKAALKAPDKEKLNKWIDGIFIGFTPSVGGEAHKVACQIQDKFSGFKRWAKEQIENL